jgi:nucleoid-associated protein YgaU
VHEASYFVPTRPDLEQLAPPPALPEAFQPAAPASTAPSSAAVWQPPRRPIFRKDQLPRKHRVRDGDNLENLAERFLGSAARANEIYAANSSLLSTPDLLPIGKTIVIPPRITGAELEAQLETAP